MKGKYRFDKNNHLISQIVGAWIFIIYHTNWDVYHILSNPSHPSASVRIAQN